MSLMNSFDGFIFDYGGVLVYHQTDSDQVRMAKVAGVPADSFTELYWKQRLDYDKGLVSGEEYWEAVATGAGKFLSAQQIADLTELDNVSWMNFDEPMWDFVSEMRGARKKVAVLSNMPKDLGRAIRERTNRFEAFDHVTLSFEVRSAKPEPEIYEECVGGLGTARARTLFFDDRLANVQGAEMLGMRAIEFNDRDSVLDRVRSGNF
jgi:putative hydrolase of the HAD superfamily